MSFLRIYLRRYFVYTVTPLGLDNDKSLEDISFVVCNRTCRYNSNDISTYSPR